MPPQGWYEDRVAGSEFGRHRHRQRISKPRKACEIGVTQRYQTHRRARGREVERSDIKVRNLVGWKKRESTAAADHAPNVVPLIEVSGRSDRIAEPNSWQDGVVDDSQTV